MGDRSRKTGMTDRLSQSADGDSKPATARQLGVLRMAGYGIGDLGINLYFNMALVFLPIFYTDVFGLAPALMATLLLVARLVDAVTDPLMGAIADKTQTKMGKFRPYVLAGAPLMGVIAVLTFTVPDLPEDQKVTYAFVTYILFGIAYTIMGIPYSSLTAAITKNPIERTDLSAFRMGFAGTGGLIVNVGTVMLVAMFATQAAGYQASMALYAVIATLTLWITVISTKELPRAEDKPPTLKDMARTLSKNAPLALVFGGFLFGTIAHTSRSAFVPYYFKYYIGDESLIPTFMLFSAIGGILGLVATPAIVRWLGKRKTYIIAGLLGTTGGFIMYFIPADQLTLLYVVSAVSANFGAAPAIMGWAMLPDTVEYGEWKTGVRAEGATYALSSFCQKVAMAIGGTLTGLVLAGVGYVPNEIQTPEAENAIVTMMTLFPALIGMFGIGCMAFYKLDQDTHSRIVKVIEARRAERIAAE